MRHVCGDDILAVVCHALTDGQGSPSAQLQDIESLLRDNWERPLDVIIPSSGSQPYTLEARHLRDVYTESYVTNNAEIVVYYWCNCLHVIHILLGEGGCGLVQRVGVWGRLVEYVRQYCDCLHWISRDMRRGGCMEEEGFWLAPQDLSRSQLPWLLGRFGFVFNIVVVFSAATRLAMATCVDWWPMRTLTSFHS